MDLQSQEETWELPIQLLLKKKKIHEYESLTGHLVEGYLMFKWCSVQTDQ